MSFINRILHRYPLPTKMFLAGTIAAGGDIFTQLLEKQSEWNYKRTARFFTLATFFTVPVLNIWHKKVLERIFYKNNMHKTVFLRVFLDQLIFSPLIMAGILMNLRVLEGFSISQSYEKMKKQWFQLYLTSLTFLPAIQFINFYFIPPIYRILLLQFVAFFWNSYLSWKTQKKIEN
ncbi:unnamed protein product [Caenorhabditis angaria]|uniref:Mitochondrial inner membrane protein Mpv17 n=1 Tax=Caenorhabditis angaria TaxID=860376 RepID=A0A9P1IDG0_9PELO|nr:unnamed protein product [Caenorhabditis angaria]